MTNFYGDFKANNLNVNIIYLTLGLNMKFEISIFKRPQMFCETDMGHSGTYLQGTERHDQLRPCRNLGWE